MAADRKPGFSSPFDAMLDDNRRAFEALSAGTGSSLRQAAPVESRTPIAGPRLSVRPVRTAPSAAGKSDAVRFLDDRYGHGWRYEIAERRRDGDEIIVLCKLIIGDQETAKSQFGRARVGGATAITGRADGVRFTIGAEPERGAADAGDPEEAAFRRAVDAALANCVEML